MRRVHTAFGIKAAGLVATGQRHVVQGVVEAVPQAQVGAPQRFTVAQLLRVGVVVIGLPVLGARAHGQTPARCQRHLQLAVDGAVVTFDAAAKAAIGVIAGQIFALLAAIKPQHPLHALPFGDQAQIRYLGVAVTQVLVKALVIAVGAVTALAVSGV